MTLGVGTENKEVLMELGDTAEQPSIKETLKSAWEPVLGAMISFHVRFNSLSFAVSGA